MKPPQFYQWFSEIWAQFPGLKKWQALGLTLMAYGIIRARRVQCSLMAEELAMFGKVGTVERRLQRWIGNERIDVEETSASWMAWVMRKYGRRRLDLLVDETKLADRIGVMMVSLAYRKRAIPLVWRCYRANSAAAYPPEGQVGLITGLLERVMRQVPQGCEVVVQADRGIGHSSNLMRAVQAIPGLDFLFRINRRAVFQSQTQPGQKLYALAQKGQAWHGDGQVFTRERAVDCHLHILWEPEQDEAWCLATSLSGLTGREYARRIWQEESFRDLKSGGWQWQDVLSRDPLRMERLLLAMVLAYTWCLSLGVFFETLPEEKQRAIDCRRKQPKYSLFRRGLRYFKYLHIHRPALLRCHIGPFP